MFLGGKTYCDGSVGEKDSNPIAERKNLLILTGKDYLCRSNRLNYDLAKGIMLGRLSEIECSMRLDGTCTTVSGQPLSDVLKVHQKHLESSIKRF